jgi:hypothetical protein
MKWSEINSNPSGRVLRQFGCLCLVFLAALGAHQYRRGRHGLGLALATVGLLLGGAGLARPATLRWLFVGWMKLAFPLNWAVSELVLGIMFYGILTPLGLVFRLMGRDPLGRKAAPGCASFWVRKAPSADVRRYFRQY